MMIQVWLRNLCIVIFIIKVIRYLLTENLKMQAVSMGWTIQVRKWACDMISIQMREVHGKSWESPTLAPLPRKSASSPETWRMNRDSPAKWKGTGEGVLQAREKQVQRQRGKRYRVIQLRCWHRPDKSSVLIPPRRNETHAFPSMLLAVITY